MTNDLKIKFAMSFPLHDKISIKCSCTGIRRSSDFPLFSLLLGKRKEIHVGLGQPESSGHGIWLHVP